MRCASRGWTKLCLALCAEMLVVSVSSRIAIGHWPRSMKRSPAVAQLEIFGKMVAALGGPKDFVESPDKYLADGARYSSRFTRMGPVPR